MLWLGVFLLGGCGALARVWAATLVEGRLFPWATLAVNVLGCLAIGAVFEWMALRGTLQPETRSLVVTGFLGGFTTFSTFGQETIELVSRGEPGAALASVAASLALGLGGVMVGALTVRSALA